MSGEFWWTACFCSFECPLNKFADTKLVLYQHYWSYYSGFMRMTPPPPPGHQPLPSPSNIMKKKPDREVSLKLFLESEACSLYNKKSACPAHSFFSLQYFWKSICMRIHKCYWQPQFLIWRKHDRHLYYIEVMVLVETCQFDRFCSKVDVQLCVCDCVGGRTPLTRQQEGAGGLLRSHNPARSSHQAHKRHPQHWAERLERLVAHSGAVHRLGVRRRQSASCVLPQAASATSSVCPPLASPLLRLYVQAQHACFSVHHMCTPREYISISVFGALRKASLASPSPALQELTKPAGQSWLRHNVIKISQ